MKSLTEKQLRAMLEKAWEDGGSTFYDGHPHLEATPWSPSDQQVKERDEMIDNLIKEC